MNRLKELLVLPSTLVTRLLLGHIAPVLIVTLALGMTLASLLRMTSVLKTISEIELSALHKESALHRASWSLDVTLRRYERACHIDDPSAVTRDDIQQRTTELRDTLQATTSAGPLMHELAEEWLAVAEEVLSGKDVCAELHLASRQQRRAQLDERMTDLWANRLTELHTSLEEKEEQARRIGVRSTTAGTILSLFSFILSLSLARRMARSVNVPLARLAKTAQLVGRGEFTTRVEVDGPAEIVALADEIDRMQTRLAELDNLKQSFLASVSHELRTPLSKIREALALLADGAVGPLDSRQMRVIQIARIACEREIRMVTTLLDLSRLRTGSPLLLTDGVAVDSVVETASSDERSDAVTKDVRVTVETIGESPLCRLDPVLLERAIANLVRNAVSVTPTGGSVRVRRETTSRPGHAGTWVRISVSDDGPGVPEEIRDTVFDAFVTRSVPRSPKAIGIGLGLALAHEVARAHRGDLVLDDPTEGGATFLLWLPLDPPPSSPTRTAGSQRLFPRELPLE